jgi:hypothetical protein
LKSVPSLAIHGSSGRAMCSRRRIRRAAAKLRR